MRFSRVCEPVFPFAFFPLPERMITPKSMRLCLLAAILLLAVLCSMALSWQEKKAGLPLLLGGLSLGGAWLICLVFSLRDYWHGVIGAGAVALLTFTRALPQLRQLGDWLNSPPPRAAPVALIEVAIAGLAAIVFVIAAKAVMDERERRLIDSLKHDQ